MFHFTLLGPCPYSYPTLQAALVSLPVCSLTSAPVPLCHGTPTLSAQCPCVLFLHHSWVLQTCPSGGRDTGWEAQAGKTSWAISANHFRQLETTWCIVLSSCTAAFLFQWFHRMEKREIPRKSLILVIFTLCQSRSRIPSCPSARSPLLASQPVRGRAGTEPHLSGLRLLLLWLLPHVTKQHLLNTKSLSLEHVSHVPTRKRPLFENTKIGYCSWSLGCLGLQSATL